MTRDVLTADVIVIGAGIAGASMAARLAGKARVLLLEMEAQAGYHATGRSAANFEPTYGPPVIRALTRASGAFFRDPPEAFAAVPLLSPRGVLMLGDADDGALAEEYVGLGYRACAFAEAKQRYPLLREGVAAHHLIDDTTTDVDVEALHRGFLGRHRWAGGTLLCKAAVTLGERRGGVWHVQTSAGDCQAPVIVNAAGAWADGVAKACGVAALGLTPKRRSACIVAGPPGVDLRAWPQVGNLKETFYAKPMGGKLMISPSDAVPSEPHDAFADDMALAEAIDQYQQVFDHEVTRIESSWGGLRTFTPDGNPAIGFDVVAQGFFWCAGQGGYGIQTAPALGAVAAALLQHNPVPDKIANFGVTAAELAPARFAPGPPTPDRGR